MPDDFENPYVLSELERLFDEEERHRKIILTLSCIIVIIFLSAILFGIFFFAEREKAIYANAEIQTLESEKDAAIKSADVQPVALDGSRFYFRDGLLGQVWLPVLDGVEKNEYINDGFDEEDNGYRYYYNSDGRLSSHFGIDVSYHQKEIDWERVAASGVEFVMIRVGYRGYESGNLSSDDFLHNNIQGACDAGLDVGVYFFSQAVSVEEAVEEAEYVVSQLEGYNITYPVVFDWEIIGTDPARTDEVPADVVNNCAVAFCEIIKQNGYIPMVYSSRRLAYFKYDLSRLSEYDLWLAEYSDLPTMYYNFDMWQYSCTGRVDGIEGDVDMNICFKDYDNQHSQRLY